MEKKNNSKSKEYTECKVCGKPNYKQGYCEFHHKQLSLYGRIIIM